MIYKLCLYVLISCCVCGAGQAVANIDISPQEQAANSVIIELYQEINQLKKSLSLNERINWFSHKFIGKPYLLGALGEGAGARYDQYPRYRLDAFDCLTYVNTILALSIAHDLKSFRDWILKLNYQHHRFAFIERNHFNELAERSRLTDITSTFVDQQGKHLVKITNVLIDQPGWYSQLPINEIRLLDNNPHEQRKRWIELKLKGRSLSKVRSTITYLSLKDFFDADMHPNEFLFAQIPVNSVLEIVRVNWRMKKIIGTNLAISHIGFVIRTPKGLIFREASSLDGVVEDVLLVDYLRDSIKSPTIKGIRISQVK